MSDTTKKKILVLGSRCSGKSMLIKRLEELCGPSKIQSDEFISTKNTVGKQITQMIYKRNQRLEIHELGGALISIWWSFYTSDHFEKILFVIDVTQPWSMSMTFEFLKDIQEKTSILAKQILFVLTKTGEINAIDLVSIRELIDFNSLWYGQVEIMEINARERKNIERVLDWLTH